jgi:hypothetical protein
VVNIDNGIAAGGIAANIANRAIRKKWKIILIKIYKQISQVILVNDI